jgi:redox-sensitive bicupin YhaK (pirin superfamily)
MKANLHTANSRGHANHGWLKSYHSFSFANYFNPERMGYKALRVINDDYIAASEGFGTHPHKDMEIITIPLKGKLRHKDTMGNETVISSGEVQLMSAGTGIYHSEYNDTSDEEVNMLQIWVLPKKLGIEPRYDQKKYHLEDRTNKWQLVVSPDGREGSVEINQDAFFSMTNLIKGNSLSYERKLDKNGIYLFVIEGEVKVGDTVLHTRDALTIDNQSYIELAASADSNLLLIEVPEVQ